MSIKVTVPDRTFTIELDERKARLLHHLAGQTGGPWGKVLHVEGSTATLEAVRNELLSPLYDLLDKHFSTIDEEGA